jgi:hypothetical protein
MTKTTVLFSEFCSKTTCLDMVISSSVPADTSALHLSLIESMAFEIRELKETVEKLSVEGSILSSSRQA